MDRDHLRRVRFTKIFEENFRLLLGYAARRVDKPADAADVVAETFLVAWRRIDDAPNGDETRLWLYGVARNVLNNQRRSEQRRLNLADRLRQEMSKISVDPVDDSAQRLVVDLAIGRLQPSERELLQLTAWEGLEPTEIAAIYGIPAGTVRRRLHHARNNLRTELNALGWKGGFEKDSDIRRSETEIPTSTVLEVGREEH